ncbi:alpha/beta fold hydrolase [Loktanella sp. IMCC34160]|uniref:alpha/beta fold hydrolase n=1 Tax=Loktanella sp. IMCC34160 TaxID=2510646 RepID=UPI00101BA896|nr:alpha/beta fold hydrolase [Loktanella sp. IMCC34160]RYG92232.1 alpha/beta fold hydrolase [Loktanella sp. IMCC34160]
MPVAPDGTAYDLTGPEGAPVVALIHGLGLNRAVTWAQIGPALSAGFRVLTYDLPGHGESAPPSGPVTLRMLGDQVVALLDHLGIDRAALVGFSLGGMINRRVAIDHPARVSALAILNSPHDRGAEQQRLAEERARNNAAGGPAAGIDQTMERWFTDAFRSTNPDAVAQVRAAVLSNDAETYSAHRRVLVEGVVELIRPDPPLTVPTLVMTCENDVGSTPAMSADMGREISGATVTIVPGLKHLGLIEQPKVFSDAVEAFLAGV